MTRAGGGRPVLLDCDPGIDDAFAIMFACGHPDLDLVGVTTVAGNVSLALTTANALAVLDFAGRPDVPVISGCAAPLLRPALDGSTVHGEGGLGAARLPRAAAGAAAGHAADYLIERVRAAPGEITLVATGPLTNIALAVLRYPPLAKEVAGFVIMGGSAGRGNVTPAAEFNIACDPEAASIVFSAGWRVTMIGLDVTLQARATAGIRERMRGLGRLGSDLLLPGLGGYHGDPAAPPPPPPGRWLAPGVAGAGEPAPGAMDGMPTDPLRDAPPVHDVCAVAFAAKPGLFGCLPARVRVETAGRWTSGMTVTDFAALPDQRNALVALSIDVAAFWELVLAAYARTPPAAGPG